MKKALIQLLFSITFITAFTGNLYAQPASSADRDSSRLRISLLTCTPGEDLYSIFGHSAFRVIDSNAVTDNVYNYGTFDFDDPGFYVKFTRGKLLYFVSLEDFKDFKTFYQYENRGITEQVLDLSATEKENIRHALNENLKEENKYYKYDFFKDNCTTRLRDMLVNNKSPKPVLPAVMPANTRCRQAIHQYLDNGKQYWSKLGLDILMGYPTDVVMTAQQQQFLPDNLMKTLDSCKNPSLVVSSNELYKIPAAPNSNSWFTPMLFFSLLFVLFVWLSSSKNRSLQTILKGLDWLLFFLTGLLGIILVFMWTGTDHAMTKNNYNLLWAWPTHIIASLFMYRNSNFIKKYFLAAGLGMGVVLLVWFFLPQQMNNALLPLVLLLLYRSMVRYFK